MKELPQLLEWYQEQTKSLYGKTYTYSDLGYGANNINCVLGIQYEMAQAVLFSSEQQIEPLEMHLGNSMLYLAAYCNNNNLNLREICGQGPVACYNETKDKGFMFETFLEQHRKEMTFEQDMEDEDKILYVKLLFSGIFPPETPMQFIEYILHQNINTNK